MRMETMMTLTVTDQVRKSFTLNLQLLVIINDNKIKLC